MTGEELEETTEARTQAHATGMTSEGILDALQRLAQMRSAKIPTGGTFVGNISNAIPDSATPLIQSLGIGPDTVAINQQLLSSLNEMQHTPAIASGTTIVNQVRMVRESENAQQIGGLGAVTIDIVAMLFDFIFDDIHIPIAIKSLLSRLQIPVLKVAMLNPGFFADRQHPTRRFLGSVSGVSIRWGNSVDETDPFYKKLAELVEHIQTEFENDVEVFGTTLEELEEFVKQHEDEEESTALTAANIVIQRERKAESWERAQRTIKTFQASTTLPSLINDFIGEHWISVLQSIAAKNDEDGTEWNAAKKTMQDLAWSVTAKKSPGERLQLIDLLPKLLAQLNKGLDCIDANPADRAAFFDALMNCHSAALKGEPVSATPVLEKAKVSPSITPPQEGDLLMTRSIDNGVEVEEVILVGASPIWRTDDREIYRQVSELKRGDWVEFHEADGKSNRERLNWISPQRGILLFSNHRSSKAISITPEALARQIRDSKATILEAEEIFERALGDALETMNAG